MAKLNGRRLVDVLKQVTVEPFLFFVLFGYTVRTATFQNILVDRACRNVEGFDADVCDDVDAYPREQAASIRVANNLYTGIMLTSSLPSLVVAVFLGPWSDKYSRKYPLILAVVGMFLESLSSAVLTAFTNVTPWLYVAVSLFSGVSGGYVISISASYSYMSDITDERSRPSRFAVLEFFSIGALVVGSFVEGRVFSAVGALPVMCLAPCSFLCGLLYVTFFLRDTKPRVGLRMDMVRDLVSVDNVKQSYHTCTKERPGNMRLQIWLLVWVICSYRLADMGIISLSFPFARRMYGWGVEAYTGATIAFSFAKALLTVVVVPALSQGLRLHEAAIGLVSVLALMAELTLLSVAYREAIFYFAFISGTLASGTAIAVTSRLSKLVHKDELGRAFSFLGIFESLTPLFGTVLFLQIYNASVHFFPGLAFAASAVFLLPCALIFTWMMKMPTVSLGDFGREGGHSPQPLEDMSSCNTYTTLQEKQSAISVPY